MKTSWLINAGNKELLIFFAGWGQSPDYFKKFKSDQFDVLMVYHYQNIEFELINNIIEGYQTTHCLGWSFGVKVCDLFIDQAEISGSKIALNGSFLPVHEEYGIPKAIFQGTLDGLSQKNWEKFMFRICGNKTLAEELVNYNLRSIDTLKEELQYLGEISNLPSSNNFNSVQISNKDRIFPISNLKTAWEEKNANLVTTNLPHFPFESITSWEEIVSPQPEVCHGN
ncbi:pimeloyl-ACP methyl esterase BioG family protein [Flammeovirga sp. SubArs3]|uniref:pimeloyl-ACP methyl esterase BioG family protein n=1 Tax=Flammeovirga sp. SubArs3 TaxID=2995316 RepID=UPI00248C014B|nr:pimeloyl-ACP methyl esterase BioG family protein [Flammeovirga sp. SubArs3]